MCKNKYDRLRYCLDHPKPQVFKVGYGRWVAWDSGPFAIVDSKKVNTWEEAYAFAVSYATQKRV